jgi:competence protein ComGC
VKAIFNTPAKKAAGFFILYFLLMVSIIAGVTTSNSAKQKKEVHSHSVLDIGESFKKEMSVYEIRKAQREAELSDRWRPSEWFVIIALTASSILDIVIVLLWARHENRKREGKPQTVKPRLTDRRWFWNIMAMGIDQPKNNKLVINWRNLVLVIIAMYFVKKSLVDQL